MSVTSKNVYVQKERYTQQLVFYNGSKKGNEVANDKKFLNKKASENSKLSRGREERGACFYSI